MFKPVPGTHVPPGRSRVAVAAIIHVELSGHIDDRAVLFEVVAEILHEANTVEILANLGPEAAGLRSLVVPVGAVPVETVRWADGDRSPGQGG